LLKHSNMEISKLYFEGFNGA